MELLPGLFRWRNKFKCLKLRNWVCGTEEAVSQWWILSQATSCHRPLPQRFAVGPLQVGVSIIIYCSHFTDEETEGQRGC